MAVTLCNVLDALIKRSFLKINVLINRIKPFTFNETEKHNLQRPNFWYEPGGELKTKQSRAEMLCLVRYLGFIIGDLIPRNNQYWELYCCLRGICNSITSSRSRRSEITTLADLIRKHHTLYLELFSHLTPKMHFWVHYPRMIELYGPVVHFSTNVFERNIKVLKAHAKASVNNLFLPRTIGEKHQLELFYKTAFFPINYSDLELSPEKNVPQAEILNKLSLHIPSNSNVAELEYIAIFGKKYFASKVEDVPQFSEIKNIHLINSQVF